LVFPSDQEPARKECVNISIIADEIVEEEVEVFSVSLSTSNESVVVSTNIANVFIFDNSSK
jgi:hypothetical protein